MTHKAINTSLIWKVVIESYRYDSHDWGKLKQLKNLEQLTIFRPVWVPKTFKDADIVEEGVRGAKTISPPVYCFSKIVPSLIHKGVKIFYVARLHISAGSPRRTRIWIAIRFRLENHSLSSHDELEKLDGDFIFRGLRFTEEARAETPKSRHPDLRMLL